MKNVKFNSKAGFILLISLFLLSQAILPLSVFSATNIQIPIPNKPSVTNITLTSICLSWTTPADNIDIKGYHVYRDGKEIASTTNTQYTNNKLIPGKSYSYFIRSFDASGNISYPSTTINATTVSDLQKPSTLKTLEVFSKTYTLIALTWNPSTDNTNIKGYEIYCYDKKIALTSDTYYVCKGLTPGKSYTFFVYALDIAGNYSLQKSITASTLIDNIAPSVPMELKASDISGIEINLTWSPSLDNVKVKNYEIFCDGLKIQTTTKVYYSIKNLSPGKSYTYSVRAIDTIGNISPLCSPLKISTLNDFEAPSPPQGLNVTAVNEESVSLTWKPAIDNIEVKGYNVFCNGFKIAITNKTTYKVKNPPGLGLDIYYVKAFDLNDNISNASNNASIIR